VVVDNAKDTQTAGSFLTDRDGTELRVDTSAMMMALDSRMDDSMFGQLDKLKIPGPNGSLQFTVTGFGRYTDAAATHGSTVIM